MREVFEHDPRTEEVWPALDSMIEDLVEDANPYDVLDEEVKYEIARGMREFMLTEFELRKIASREDVYGYIEIDDDEDDYLEQLEDLLVD